MKIKEIVNYDTKKITDLKSGDMFIITSPTKIYMYIETLYHGSIYLELVDGCWKDTGIAFHTNEPISIIEIETLEYKKRAV